jgi:3D (Asp-Asp-Asp) domain-containing protein
MHRTKHIAVFLAGIVVYGMPAFIAHAGTDPTSTMATQAALTPTGPTPVATLSLRITAYSSTPDQTDSTPFITANGTYVHDGIVATNLLPFGTKIEIPALFGDKILTVEDRMNVRYSKSVDIWMPSTAKALFFGVHYNTQVVVLSTSTADSDLSLK